MRSAAHRHQLTSTAIQRQPPARTFRIAATALAGTSLKELATVLSIPRNTSLPASTSTQSECADGPHGSLAGGLIPAFDTEHEIVAATRIERHQTNQIPGIA